VAGEVRRVRERGGVEKEIRRIIEAALQDPRGMGEAVVLSSDRRMTEKVADLLSLGGPDLTAEVETARTEMARLQLELWSDELASELGELRQIYDATMSSELGAKLDAWLDLVGCWRDRGGKPKSECDSEPSIVERKLSLTYAQALATLETLARTYYDRLCASAPADSDARRQLCQMIERTLKDCRGVSDSRRRDNSGDLYGLIPELPWPNGFDDWVAAKEQSPEVCDFSRQPSRTHGEWLHLAVEVAHHWNGDSEIRRIAFAKIILANWLADPEVEHAVGEDLRNELADIVVAYDQVAAQ